MAQFMDVQRGMKGISPEELLEAHHCDVDMQDEEGVNFKQAWADPIAGVVSACPRLLAPRPLRRSTGLPGTGFKRFTRWPSSCRNRLITTRLRG